MPRVEARDSFIKTLKKEPRTALSGKRTWSPVVQSEKKFLPPIIKLGKDEIAVVLGSGDEQVVRVFSDYGRYQDYINEQINEFNSPLYKKVRRV